MLTISTLAGGEEGFIDGPLNEAKLNIPTSVCFVPPDSIYFTEIGNHTIRKILNHDTDAIIDVVAGSYYPGYQDGSASSSLFNSPYDICFYSKNNALIIVDKGNNCIRSYFINGSYVSTIFKIISPSCCTIYKDKCFISSISGVFVINLELCTEIYRIGSTNPMPSLIDGSFAVTQLNHPEGIAFSSEMNSLFICDTFNHVIRIADIESKTVFTLTGVGKGGYLNGSLVYSRFYYPRRIVLHPNGYILYVTEMNERIRIINLKEQTVGTLAGSGKIEGENRGTGKC